MTRPNISEIVLTMTITTRYIKTLEVTLALLYHRWASSPLALVAQCSSEWLHDEIREASSKTIEVHGSQSSAIFSDRENRKLRTQIKLHSKSHGWCRGHIVANWLPWVFGWHLRRSGNLRFSELYLMLETQWSLQWHSITNKPTEKNRKSGREVKWKRNLRTTQTQAAIERWD